MGAVISPLAMANISTHFEALASIIPLRAIHNKREYNRAVSALNQLLDAGAASEAHQLAPLANTLGNIIGDYEGENYPVESVAPAATLRVLMEQHRINQSDLPEVGTQGVVSEILRGKRDLNVRQIKLLAQRFHVPASVFI